MIFIYGFEMGVTGAAIGTALSEMITAVCMLYFLNQKTEMLQIDRSVKFKLKPYYLKKAARLSLPIACERFIMSGALVMTTGMVAP
jgi:Na+-driven multidrug efflux pump